jgi:hypothetical protein
LRSVIAATMSGTSASAKARHSADLGFSSTISSVSRLRCSKQYPRLPRKQL